MKIKKIVSGIACMVTLAACNLDYHEYANYGKDYIDESYENVIGMITNVYSILDYDFGQTYKGGMLASACDEAEYAPPHRRARPRALRPRWRARPYRFPYRDRKAPTGHASSVRPS